MAIWKDGSPPVNPSRPYNPVTAMDSAVDFAIWNNNGFYLREAHPFYTPRLGRYYATNRLSTATDRLGLIIRYDSSPSSSVTFEKLSNCSPYKLVGHQTPVLVGDGVLVAQDAISLSNGYQWITPNKSISTSDGVYLAAGTKALYVVTSGSGSKCYKTADCTAEDGIQSTAVWTEQGTPGWGSAPSAVTLLKSGDRLIAWSQTAGNVGIEIMVSDDDGATWTSKYTRAIAGITYTIPTFVQRGTDSVLILYREGDLSGPTTYIVTLDTTDNGDNWTRTIRKTFGGASIGTWTSFLYIDASTWLMTAKSDFQSIAPATIIRSTDSGANWTVVYDTGTGNASGNFHNYGFEIDTAVRASDGRILNVYSEDDGATWTEIETGFSTTNGRPDWFGGEA